MKHNNSLTHRFMKWKFFSVLVGLTLARAALATDALYQNYAVLNYDIPGNPPPQIDATNFDNESVFNVNWGVYSVNPAFYETLNTLNYTNNGTMTVNAPIISSSSSGFVIVGETFAPGFKFDLQTTNVTTPHKMAGSFYNPGTVRCNSFLDGNNVFNFGGILGFSLGTFGECVVSATNVINSGTIEAGVNSLIQITGQNVDMTRGTLNVESLQNFFLSGNTPGVYSAAYGFGIDTNKDWDPFFALTAATAYSSLPYIISLTNSTAYYDLQQPATNLNIIRAVFVQNKSPNATYNVYIDPLNASPLFAAGAAHVEWVSTAVNPADCSSSTTYLYLTDDYVAGANVTNLFINNGTPDNFTFITSTTRLLSGPLAPGFPGFPNSIVTNTYSYFDGQLVSTTTPTNATPLNPSGALTNLPGRIQITASRDLNLGLSAISGQNYLSLTATNQFDGSVGALIAAPYSDLNLGVTNGIMAVTNLLESTIPNWNGSVAAWSTRFLNVVSNTVDGINYFMLTNDYRVLIVRSSQMNPATAPQVQDLKLHATNSLVISDVLNILRSLSIDSQNLTLTTNGCGNAADSLEGELNFENGAILWQNSLPNLRNLTNNGAIRIGNLALFGGPPPANYFSFVNHGLITDQGSTIYANYFEDSGPFTNGVGSFQLWSLNTIITNGTLVAGADVSITTTNLLMGSLALQAGRALTLQVTNALTDGGVTNGNRWVLGSAGVGGSDSGFNLPILPGSANRGDLLGTTVLNIAPTNKSIVNVWAGQDLGATLNGYTNNEAVGHLILDSFGSYFPLNRIGTYTFTGTGAGTNALYVDLLELRDAATNRDANGNFSALNVSPNMVIYFASAFMNGVSVADKMNGKNNNRLRWIPAYTGYFSATNFVNFDGTTNVVNISVLDSTSVDSDGDGIPNASDPTPFWLTSEVDFTYSLTNLPPEMVRLVWHSIPSATNLLKFSTNLVNTSTNPALWEGMVTSYVSPSLVPPAGGWPITNIVFDPITITNKVYRVFVNPSSATQFGP